MTSSRRRPIAPPAFFPRVNTGNRCRRQPPLQQPSRSRSRRYPRLCGPPVAGVGPRRPINRHRRRPPSPLRQHRWSPPPQHSLSSPAVWEHLEGCSDCRVGWQLMVRRCCRGLPAWVAGDCCQGWPSTDDELWPSQPGAYRQLESVATCCSGGRRHWAVVGGRWPVSLLLTGVAGGGGGRGRSDS